MKTSLNRQSPEAFLASKAVSYQRLEAFANDASFRSYSRLHGGSTPTLLMDAPPGREDVYPFVTLAQHLVGLGIKAPEIYHFSRQQGYCLLEDFGDATFTRLITKGADVDHLYAAAGHVLGSVHSNEKGVLVDIPTYSMAEYLREVALFTDWYLPDFSAEGRTEFLRSFEALLAPLVSRTDTLVLRDYHVDNLMWVGAGPSVDQDPIAHVGVLDFQDAVKGPKGYDVASFIYDARRDVSESERTAFLTAYKSAFTQLDNAALEEESILLGLQRTIKILGIFVRLAKRDQKPIYLKHLPRLIGYVHNELASPATQSIKAILDHYAPNWQDLAGHYTHGARG